MKIRDLIMRMIDEGNLDEEAYVVILELNRKGEIRDKTSYPVAKYNSSADEIIVELTVR